MRNVVTNRYKQIKGEVTARLQESKDKLDAVSPELRDRFQAAEEVCRRPSYCTYS